MICRAYCTVSKDPLLQTRKNAKVKVNIKGRSTEGVVERAENVLSQLVPLDSMEKMQITVSFEILSCDGCLADYIVNLAVYTMTVGNIVLRDTVTSATCCLTADDRLVLDPTNEDLKESKGHVRVAVSV